jgi:hypothetical protein
MIIRSFGCVVFVITSVLGQTVQEAPNAFYIGRGEHASLDAARSRAYANMVEQIQVLVSSSLRTTTSEHDSTLFNSADQSTLSFSSIVLRDVQERVDEGQGVYRVMKYVPKSVVQSIFDGRRHRIIEYLEAAEAEGEGAADVDIHRMLGNYYKAWLMTGLYPDTISYQFRFGGRSSVMIGIPRAMQRVCDNIVFSPARKIDDEYTTWKYAVRWLDRPVRSMRFTFQDGLGESEEEVRNGSAQVTFLFTDKRERLIPARLEYHEEDREDVLLAVADSMMTQFAPKPAIQFLLPGEPLAAAAPRADRATEQAYTSVPAEAGGIQGAQVRHDAVILPAALQSLMAKRGDRGFVTNEISRLSKRGDIITGKKNDFEALDGLYVLVFDADGIEAILVHQHGALTNTTTGDQISLPAYGGKRILWVKVQ